MQMHFGNLISQRLREIKENSCASKKKNNNKANEKSSKSKNWENSSAKWIQISVKQSKSNRRHLRI